jgi:hypothetical protein
MLRTSKSRKKQTASNPQSKDRFFKVATASNPNQMAQFIGQQLGLRVRHAELVNTDFKQYIDRQADIVLKVYTEEDGDEPVLIHIEYQTTNEPFFYCRMGIYRFMLIQSTGIERIHSVVVYAGSQPCQLDLATNQKGLNFAVNLIDLTQFDLSEILTNDSIFVRLFAIFNQTLPRLDIAEQLAKAIVDYTARHLDMKGKTIMDIFFSICNKNDKDFYMDVKSYLHKAGLPIGDFRDSFVYIEGMEVGEIKTAIRNGVALIRNKSFTVPEVIQTLEMNDDTAKAFTHHVAQLLKNAQARRNRTE